MRTAHCHIFLVVSNAYGNLGKALICQPGLMGRDLRTENITFRLDAAPANRTSSCSENMLCIFQNGSSVYGIQLQGNCFTCQSGVMVSTDKGRTSKGLG